MNFKIKKELRRACVLLLSLVLLSGFSACDNGVGYENGDDSGHTSTDSQETEINSDGESSAEDGTEDKTELGTEDKTEDTTEDGTEEESSEEFTLPGISDGTGIFYKGFGENERFVIVIDAGHQSDGMYGKEPNGPGSDVMKTQLAAGTVGAFTDIPEYELTLAVSLSLRNELLRRGYTVVMVRETNDVAISNMERAFLANKYKPSDENGYLGAVNVRVHANGLDNETVRGVLMVCSTEENEYIGELYGECYALSEKILGAYADATGMPKRTNPVRYDDTMTGTNWCEIPTTIIELGFLTNKEDDELMATDAFKADAAKGIADGLDDYFDDYR